MNPSPLRTESAHILGARLLLHGRIRIRSSYRASPAEMGEGRERAPVPPPDPRDEPPSESSDSESD